MATLYSQVGEGSGRGGWAVAGGGGSRRRGGAGGRRWRGSGRGRGGAWAILRASGREGGPGRLEPGRRPDARIASGDRWVRGSRGRRDASGLPPRRRGVGDADGLGERDGRRGRPWRDGADDGGVKDLFEDPAVHVVGDGDAEEVEDGRGDVEQGRARGVEPFRKGGPLATMIPSTRWSPVGPNAGPITVFVVKSWRPIVRYRQSLRTTGEVGPRWA